MILFQQNLQSSGQSLTLTASVGSFSVSGQDAQIKVGRTLTAQQSSFTLDGQAVGLSLAYRMAANIGEFVVSGQDLTINKDGAIGYSILAEFGQVTLLGQTVQIIKTAKPTTQGGVKRPQPVFTPRDYREQLLKEDEMLLMFINEMMINIK
jgi:hypothetical protein